MYACDFIFNCLSIYLSRCLTYLPLCIDNISTLSENIKFLRDLEKWVEKRGFNFGELFCPVSQRVQNNFTFSENVRILCLSCNF